MAAAALGSVHGPRMEEIILGELCTKSRLAVSPCVVSVGSMSAPPVDPYAGGMLLATL